MVGCALCLAQAAVLVRRFPPVHPVTLNAVGMLVGATLLLTGSAILGEDMVAPHRTATWFSIGYMVVFGSIVAFVLYAVVLGRWSASRAAYVFVVSPLFAVALGNRLDGESLNAGLFAGGALIVAGVYIGALRQGVPAPAQNPSGP
jgi:drug/metabolite transporter (DMT)-like permease